MPRRPWLWCSLVLLLLLFWARVLVNAHDQSPVADEPAHFIRALAYWRGDDFRLQRGHPPVSHALSGLPLMLEPGLPSPADLPGWDDASRLEVADSMLSEPDRPITRLFFLGRFSTIGLGLVLCALLGRWAGELFGPGAGVTALFLCTFDPNVLAHASLVTTDVPVTCMIFAAGYAFQHWLEHPTPGRLLFAGCALGLALGAKLSALLLVPVAGLVVVWQGLRQRQNLGRLLFGFSALLAVGALALWAVYRFEVGPWPEMNVSLPLPTYWGSLRHLQQHQVEGHRAFFVGQISGGGWWYYFPVLFLIKTPLPLLLLLPLAVVQACRSPCISWPPLVLPLVVCYFAISMGSQINIGYRHILPLIPFILLVAAPVFRISWRTSRWWALLLVGLALWMAITSLAVHPYYLAYFNELVGGPDKGYRYAVDSNLDWGQDLKRLARYLDERGIERVKLSYFGGGDPDWYGIEYEPLPSGPTSPPPAFGLFNPEPGLYAISVSSLQGVALADVDTFDWFRRQQPLDKIGYSIFLYEVPSRPGGRWAAICAAPAPALEASQAWQVLDDDTVRLTFFDCRSSWVYPAGTDPGWYVIPDTTDGPTLAPAHGDDVQIVFHGRPSWWRPGLTAYRGQGAVDHSSHWMALAGADRQREFGEVARFLGYETESDALQGTVVLRTYWQVLSQIDFPISVMAHLMDEHGVVGIADGLGFGVENWREGDVFAQQHVFDLPAGDACAPCTLHVGLYRLDGMEAVPPVGLETDYVVAGVVEGESGD